MFQLLADVSLRSIRAIPSNSNVIVSAKMTDALLSLLLISKAAFKFFCAVSCN